MVVQTPVIMDISKYKQELLSKICSNSKIIEAIDSQQDGAMSSEPDTLIGKNLFPYMRVPETENFADTHIMLSVDVERPNRNNRTYSRYHTTIWVLCALNRMEMPQEYNATRIDYIAEQLTRMFHNVRNFGFTDFELMSNREALLDSKFLYRELVFRCSDLREAVGQR